MHRSIIIAVVVATVSFSHYFVYNKGREAIQAKWDKDKLVQTEQALQKQQQLQIEKQKSDERYADEKRKAAVAVNAAKSELDRLRDALANRGEESASSCTVPGTNGRAGLEQELLGQCATTLVAMAAEADRLEAIIVGLQSYVKNVCLAK